MQRERVIEKLRSVPLFAGLSKAELQALLTRMAVWSYRKDTTVVVEGEKGLSMFVLLSGAVKVCTKDREGNELFLAALGEGEFFGEMALLSGQPRNATVTTTEDSDLLELSKEGLDRAIKRRPELREILERYYRERKQGTARVFVSRGIIERRQGPRFKEPLDVRLRVSLNEGGRVVSRMLQGVTADLTDRGLCLEVEGDLLAGFSSTLPGTPVAVELTFASPHKVLRLPGEVRWCAEVKKNMEFWFRLGIAFGEISAHERRFLREFAYGGEAEEESLADEPAVHDLEE